MADDSTKWDEHIALEAEPDADIPQSLDIPVNSPAMQRLIDEVRSEEFEPSRSYNRTFNRHNR